MGARFRTLQEWRTERGRAKKPVFIRCTQVRGFSLPFRIELRRRLLARSFARHLAWRLPSVTLNRLLRQVAMNARVDINETYLTVADIAERLKVNEETARRLFLN